MMSQEANLLINLIVHGHLGNSEAQSLGLSFAEYTKKDKSVFESQKERLRKHKTKKEKNSINSTVK